MTTTIAHLTSPHLPLLEDLLQRAGAHDGAAWFSEFKLVSVRRAAGPTVGVFSADRLVAAGHAAWHHGDGEAASHWAIETVIDPASRNRAIAAKVIAATARAVPNEERHVLWGWAPVVAEAASSLGYIPTRRLSLMRRSLPTGLRPAIPAEVRLAEFRPGEDDRAWLRVNNAAFAGHPENGGLTDEDLTQRMELPWFRPEDLLLAWKGDAVIGSVWTKRHDDDVGEIYVIGVHPEHQGKGLGRALVLAGLDHLASRAGSTSGILYVDHRAGAAFELYRHLGFERVRVITMYTPATDLESAGHASESRV